MFRNGAMPTGKMDFDKSNYKLNEMDTRFFYHKGSYVKADAGTLQKVSEADVSSFCYVHPNDTTIVFFREANEHEPEFFRKSSIRVRIVSLNHGDNDVLRPILEREAKDVAEQVITWLNY